MDDSAAIQARLAFLEAELPAIQERLSALETRIDSVARAHLDQQALKRFVETKTGRSGEMSTRIAQRLAKCEAAIEILARVDDRESIDHA